jgi:hypothetical protein
MREQQSVTESPLDLRWRFLADLADALGNDPAGYAAVAVRDVCSAICAAWPRRAQTIASTTRSFLGVPAEICARIWAPRVA